MLPAYKNRGNQTPGGFKQSLIYGCILLMWCSVFISRGALSVSTILFLLLTIGLTFRRNSLTYLLTDAFSVGLLLLFFIPFLSGLWSSNIDKWADVVRLKLPLFFFPLAFVSRWQFTKKQWLILAGVVLLTVAVACACSLLQYITHAAEVHRGYLQAKTLSTPLQNDHVRFSWLVSIAFILCFLLMKIINHRKASMLLSITALFFLIYLHILSARTGLISAYIFLLLYAGWLLINGKKKRLVALMIAGVILLPVVAYHTLPTFKNRLHYFMYDHSFLQKNQYLAGANDGARWMSIQAGWQVLEQNPLGVGAGDVMQEADKWYAVHVPSVLPSDKFYPSSEWLLYGAFAGWAGLVIFTAIMLLPFFVGIGYKIFWISLHATAAFSFVFDMGLEVQYGIFLFAFFACWWRKWLTNKTTDGG